MKIINVSKEIGVGFNTVVGYLHSRGFVIQAKPAAIVSEEMYEALLKEFHSSRAIKDKANKIIFGAQMVPKIEQPPKLVTSIF